MESYIFPVAECGASLTSVSIDPRLAIPKVACSGPSQARVSQSGLGGYPGFEECREKPLTRSKIPLLRWYKRWTTKSHVRLKKPGARIERAILPTESHRER